MKCEVFIFEWVAAASYGAAAAAKISIKYVSDNPRQKLVAMMILNGSEVSPWRY